MKKSKIISTIMGAIIIIAGTIVTMVRLSTLFSHPSESIDNVIVETLPAVLIGWTCLFAGAFVVRGKDIVKAILSNEKDNAGKEENTNNETKK